MELERNLYVWYVVVAAVSAATAAAGANITVIFVGSSFTPEEGEQIIRLLPRRVVHIATPPVVHEVAYVPVVQAIQDPKYTRNRYTIILDYRIVSSKNSNKCNLGSSIIHVQVDEALKFLREGSLLSRSARLIYLLTRNLLFPQFRGMRPFSCVKHTMRLYKASGSGVAARAAAPCVGRAVEHWIKVSRCLYVANECGISELERHEVDKTEDTMIYLALAQSTSESHIHGVLSIDSAALKQRLANTFASSTEESRRQITLLVFEYENKPTLLNSMSLADAPGNGLVLIVENRCTKDNGRTFKACGRKHIPGVGYQDPSEPLKEAKAAVLSAFFDLEYPTQTTRGEELIFWRSFDFPGVYNGTSQLIGDILARNNLRLVNQKFAELRDLQSRMAAENSLTTKMHLVEELEKKAVASRRVCEDTSTHQEVDTNFDTCHRAYLNLLEWERSMTAREVLEMGVDAASTSAEVTEQARW
eukprot:CAMPEP_0198731554 /NCGR_PEP_ID=MMETSP1475-20131203/30607_1 /TAXON_ID= ORGANISM="Unidentified sp., Strain CCMP1999" /NCGR_SAMPLE_ID=MMETSP1475 /ASSEMBLY_ACC=CAM_ASM_001111 /LENGTH=473 /DNA_ID=CAMNT_0044494531 /DNA_START=364 /DNA_END=1782 /DNA_ORIENTATION=+